MWPLFTCYIPSNYFNPVLSLEGALSLCEFLNRYLSCMVFMGVLMLGTRCYIKMFNASIWTPYMKIYSEEIIEHWEWIGYDFEMKSTFICYALSRNRFKINRWFTQSLTFFENLFKIVLTKNSIQISYFLGIYWSSISHKIVNLWKKLIGKTSYQKSWMNILKGLWIFWECFFSFLRTISENYVYESSSDQKPWIY